MTVISSREFATNQDRYFDMAMNGQVFVQRGENRFIVTSVDEKKKQHKKPDEDFYRAITMDELRRRVKEDIHQWYKERDECNSITRSTAVS